MGFKFWVVVEGVGPTQLTKPLVCYWGTQKIGLSCREIGLRLNISQQAVSCWVVKGEAYCEREKVAFEEESALSC